MAFCDLHFAVSFCAKNCFCNKQKIATFYNPSMSSPSRSQKIRVIWWRRPRFEFLSSFFWNGVSLEILKRMYSLGMETIWEEKKKRGCDYMSSYQIDNPHIAFFFHSHLHTSRWENVFHKNSFFSVFFLVLQIIPRRSWLRRVLMAYVSKISFSLTQSTQLHFGSIRV